MWRDTNSLASAGVQGESSVTSAGWLGLSRRPSSASSVENCSPNRDACCNGLNVLRPLRHRLGARIAFDDSCNLFIYFLHPPFPQLGVRGVSSSLCSCHWLKAGYILDSIAGPHGEKEPFTITPTDAPNCTPTT